MADISILSRLVSGVQRNVDVSQNSLIVGSLKVGISSPTELTKTILDNLLVLQAGGDAGALHHHDARYFTETELSSVGATSGADRIGTNNSPSNYTPAAATVQDALEAIDVALASAGGVEFADNMFRIYDDSDNTKKIAFEASAIGTGTTRTITMPNSNVNLGLIATAIQSSEKGANNGVATLDGGGKVPLAQLPSAVMTYEGVWNALTNSPTLADGVGDAGMVYRVGTAGTQDLGSGSIPFEVGDYAIYNGSTWEKSDTTDAVASVNGQTGIVVLTTSNISEGSNLYFTNLRAQTAVISQVITNGVTDKSPSEDAVFDALALKQNASANLTEADTFFGSTDISAAEAEQLTDGSNADSLHSHATLKRTMVAGEAFAANTSFAIRLAVNGETARRAYKADKDASVSDKFYVLGLALSTSAVSAGQNIAVRTTGTHILGSSDTPFSGTDIGKAVFLTASGAFSLTAPSVANEAVVRIGIVEDTDRIYVQSQVVGVN